MVNAMRDEKANDSVHTHVCSWRHVHWFDNFLRPFINNPRKLFGPHVRPGMRVLDVGCGRGFASLGLARLVGGKGLVVAADVQPEMLAMVEARAKKAGLASLIRVHHCEADGIGLDEQFDFVLAFWMVHETPDSRAFLREVFTLLRPGGRFFIAEPKYHTSQAELERLVEEAEEIGFAVLDRPRVHLSRGVILSR